MTFHIWALSVSYPDGSDEPGWAPPGWQPDSDYVTRFHTAEFYWPSVRSAYLSRSSAVRRANLLEKYGAAVRLLRAEPKFEEREYRHEHEQKPRLQVVRDRRPELITKLMNTDFASLRAKLLESGYKK